MSNKNVIAFIATGLALCLTSCVSENSSGDQPTRILYVAPDGNDAESGTIEKPLATLEGARVKVREYLKKDASQSVEVQIREGEYLLNQTVVFGPKDSGTKKNPVIYKAYPGERPVFSGAKPLTQWERCRQDPDGAPATAKGQLWVCDLPESPGKQWSIKTLYDGTSLMKRASSGELTTSMAELPEDYNMPVHRTLPYVKPDHKPITYTREFHYLNDDLKNWKNIHDIEIYWSPRHKWLVNMLPLDRIDTSTKTAWFAIDPTYRYLPGCPYTVENAIEYLDEPGEWVFNSHEGRIYFWPGKPIEEYDIRAPFIREFIRLEGQEDGPFVQYINFDGLVFHHGERDTWDEDDEGLQHDWDMYDKGNAIFRFRNAEHCSVSNCEMSYSSGGGIRLDLHCQHNIVASNHLAHLGGGAIVLSGYGPGTKDVNKYNTITDNYIHHIGKIYLHSPAIFIAQSGHNQITHNTIHDIPYDGIVTSGCRSADLLLHGVFPQRRPWIRSIRLEECRPYIEEAIRNHEQTERVTEVPIDPFVPLLHSRENYIAKNELYRVMQRLHDGNAIYFSGQGPNNRVEYNFLHDNPRGNMRLDYNCGGLTIIGNNVIVRAERAGLGIKVKKYESVLDNNFIIDCTSFYDGLANPRNTVIYQTNERESPKAGGYFTWSGGEKESRTLIPFYKAKISSIDNSIFFTRSAGHPLIPGTDLVTGKKVVPGKDDIKLFFGDPLFDEEAMKEKNFTFLEGSPALKMGIKPIDLRDVGSSLASDGDTLN